MAKISLSQSNFSIIPEGTYIFKITDDDYDETFGEINVRLETKDGKFTDQRYKLKTNDDEPNEKALNAFSFFAKTALNDFSLDEIDHADLLGHYIKAQITHTKSPSRKDPSKTVTFMNLGDMSPASGFEGETASAAPAAESSVDDVLADLGSLLGM